MSNGFDQSHINDLVIKSTHLASSMKHEYVTLEHVSLILLDDPTIIEIIENCGGSTANIIASITAALNEDTASISHTASPKLTQTVISVIQRAMQQAVRSGHDKIYPYFMMASILHETDSIPAWAFDKEGIDRIKFIQNKDSSTPGEMIPADIDPMTGEEKLSPIAALEKYCVNLNESVKSGDIDPLIGRDKEIERTLQILSRRRKNNPLLVGDPGVGKTAIAEGLAYRIVKDDVPKYMEDAIVYSLDIGLLMAGAKFRGDFEERLKGVLLGIEEVNKENKAILFIDEIHTIIGAGATSGGSMDASNLLKPALAAGKLRCIGSTTYAEYNKYFEKEMALKRRFKKIDVVEPTADETKDILKGLSSYFSEYHEIDFTSEALDLAVDLSIKHIHESRLPDKAIDVIDEAGAAQRLFDEETRLKTIGIEQIQEVVAKIARLPEGITSGSDRDRLKLLQPHISNFVYGQDTAVEELVNAIKMSRAGLRDLNKTIGSYLFSGPTGVGKTEVAKQLAIQMGVELVRLDMSEFMEKHSVSTLIGSPPGYVGYDDGDGKLIDEIDKHPHCVLLLDEIEKAHPDVYNILLQIMDDATLTSSRGKIVKFNNVILIMTSNAGAADAAKKAVGFGRELNDDADDIAIEKLFTPEFRNRLDAVIKFDSLSKEVMTDIVEKFLNELQFKLDDKNIEMQVSAEAKKWLAEKGYDPVNGARPLSRVITTHINLPISDEILFGSLEHGGKFKVDVAEDGKKLSLIYFAKPPEIKKPVETVETS